METSDAVAEALLEQVVASFEKTTDSRLAQIMPVVVRHLHAVAREVDLTSEERRAMVGFLTAVGHTCTDSRQEFELLSDVLGLSSLVETTSTGEGATLQTLTGPFYSPGAPWRELGDSINEHPMAGDVPALVHGIIRGQHGGPVKGAVVDVWQTASNRLYAVQDKNQPLGNLRGRFRTGSDGHYEFTTVRPVPYTIPDDGPVGALLKRTGRHPWRAAHIHFLVTAPGYRHLTTEIFDAASEHLHDDAVFGVATDLIIEFHSSDGDRVVGRFDFTLQPALETVDDLDRPPELWAGRPGAGGAISTRNRI